MSPAEPPTSSSPDAPIAGSPSTVPSARITLHRTSDEDARQRQVYMTLDDEKIATMLFGHEVTREIPAGHHKLRANNTLVWKTVEFDAAPGADLHFSIVNRAAPGMLWMVALLGSGPMFVTLEPVAAPVRRA